MEKTFLAFDLGASSGRGILGTIKDGNISLKEIHRFPNAPKEIEKSLFWDIDSIFSEIKIGIKKALEITKDISGIAIDTWGVDYLLLKEDGKFARLPYNYRDPRTDGIPEEIFEKHISQTDLYTKAGIQSMFFNTIYQIYAHNKTYPEDLKNSKLLFMPDALSYMLSGKATCEYTIASTSGLLNAEKRDWDEEIIEKLGLPREIFGELVEPCTFSGTLTEELQKELNAPPIPILRVGSHDTASAVASVPADPTTNWAYISCGTLALIGIENDKPILTNSAMNASCTNEGGLNKKIRLLTNINGTWLLQETKNSWNKEGKNISFQEIEEMAAEATPLKCKINPNDPTFVAPGDMTPRIKEYCKENGKYVPKTDAEIVRCIYDSLALCFKERLAEFEKMGNKKFDKLHILGGATKDQLLMQLSANYTGITVVAGPIEATAVGNIIAQGIATGTIKDLDEARQMVKKSFPTKEYIPKQ